MSPVRQLVLEALAEVSARGARPRDILDRLSEGLDRRDRAFLMEILYGVLRRRDTLDWVLRRFLKKPGRLRPATAQNLRAGLYQILYMRVPDWAAVNEAVAAEKRGKALVNAVLRSAVRERESIDKEMGELRNAALKADTAEAERIRAIAIATSHPAWLIRRWVRRLGPGAALELAEANNEIPPLTLRANTLRTSSEGLLERLREINVKAETTRWSPEGVRLEGGAHSFRELAGLHGLAVVQDEAAQLVSHMLRPETGEKVLDACAAPGGKATHLAQLMGDGGEVVAVDTDEKRISRLRENIEALGIRSITVVKGDVRELCASGTLGFFDRVLVDAPCSSLGVVRRNPDVKYRHRASDLARFKALQLELLEAASRVLTKGGSLLYASCSTEPEEGEQVAEEFLKRREDFYIIKDVVLDGFHVEGGFFRTYPHVHGMDGFFAAALGRRA